MKPLRLSAYEAYNRVRCALVRPAPIGDRCIMGSPISEAAWCPRRALEGELWCGRHLPRKAVKG